MVRNMNEICQTHDIVLIVLDTLRYDVAVSEWQLNRTPHFRKLLPQGWEERHAPGSFTYPSHHAFFAGFLPTPAQTGLLHTRLFASRFAGSETTGNTTKVFETSDIVTGFRVEGWRTLCIGGVGFFNQQTALSRVFPGLFEEAFWETRFGVTDRHSTQHQFEFAATKLSEKDTRPLFLFINVSAIHQPNYFYGMESGPDTLETHRAALRYVDSQLPALIKPLALRHRPAFCIITSDHGTTYGDDGWTGHRIAHPAVWTVPYAETVISKGEFQ